MALTFNEERDLLKLKQDQKKELIEMNKNIAIEEHERKMERLEKLLEIAKAGGVPKSEVEQE